MSVKKILQMQMDVCFTNKNWFTSLSDAVKELNDEQADFRQGSEHSVRQVVTHIIFWNERVLKQIKGMNPGEFNKENSFTFTSESMNISKMSWDDLVKKLYSVMDDWKKELDSLSDEQLLESTSDNAETKASVIANILLHNVYHLGQIVTTRKQFNTWDNKLGV
jgi:uncharacterized damage-inducible protein DinB